MISKKIIIAPDSFKGSVSSIEAADAIKAGFTKEVLQTSHAFRWPTAAKERWKR